MNTHMRNTVASIAAALSMFCNFSYAEQRLTLEKVLEHQAGVGRVLEQGEKIYFERIKPRNSAPDYLPYGYHASKEIMVVGRDGRSNPEPLFPQDTQAGYQFADPMPISPDGRYIGILKLVGWNLTPGIFDTKSGHARFFDNVLAYSNTIAPTISWVSKTEILVLMRKEPGDIDFGVNAFGMGPQKQKAVREAAWRGEKVTVSLLGAGRFKTIANPLPERSLVKINIRTGEQETLLAKPELGQEHIFFSPSRRFVLVSHMDREKLIEAGRAQASKYTVIDLKTSRTFDLPEDNVGRLPFSWSPDSEKLLFMSRGVADLDGDVVAAPVFHILNPHKNTIRSYDSVGRASLSKGDKDAVKRPSTGREPRATWMTDDIFVYAKDNEESARVDWVAVDSEGKETVLTKSFANSPDRPVARSNDLLFFLVDGDVFVVDQEGSAQNLTESIDQLSFEEIRLRGALFQSSYYAAVLPDISDVIFIGDGGDRQDIVFLESSGLVRSKFNIPVRNVELHSATRDGVVYSQHHLGEASELKLATPMVDIYKDNKQTHHNTLWTYNEHLQGAVVAGSPHRIDYKGPEGEQLYGWLYPPAGASFDDGEKYPLVVIAYAETIYPDTVPEKEPLYEAPWQVAVYGPTSRQLLSAAGYAVLLPSIPLNWPPSDPMTDMMPSIHAALDAAIETGYVDRDRLALSGHSYGGYTALSVAVQTDRFDALIAAAAPSNLISDYGQHSVLFRFEPFKAIPIEGARGQMRMGGPPWEDEERYIRNSPLFHAERVATPVMLIHGELDYVHLTQAEEMFTALAEQGKDVQFIRYWGEGHSISQSQNQRDMWKRVFGFLEDNGVTPGPKTVH